MVMLSSEFVPLTPERIEDLPWFVQDQAGYVLLKETAGEMGLRLPDSSKAIRGGKILSLAEHATGIARPEGQKTVEEFLSAERDIGIFPAFEGDTPESNRLIFLLHETGMRHFEANLTAWKGYYAAFLKEEWEKAGSQGQSPILEALKTYKLSDGRTVLVTKYEHGYESLGSSEPDQAVHEANLKQLPDPADEKAMGRFIDSLAAITIKSDEFLDWIKDKNIPDSWLKEGNVKCALRGHEWWYNPQRDFSGEKIPQRWGDRLEELTNAAYADQGVKDLYQKAFGEEFPRLLEEMIKNNLPLYLFQDGKKEKKVNGQLLRKVDALLGEMVVTHGTLYPGQIHRKLDSDSGKVIYMVTGGDRSQLYGLRGQMIDWLVSSSAASEDHQNALIDAFLRKYPDEKERRGLAMHLLYRCVSETPWFVKQEKMKEAENLVKLASEIIKGEGRWEGVNKLMKQE